jgi:alkylation response protein AidB-like acyl-CoA dehydrogenase
VDFAATDAQQALSTLTRGILADRVTPERLREIEAKGDRFDRTLWTDLADAGVLAAALPRPAGGDGFGILEQCSVLIELGRAVAPVPYLSTIVTAASALARFGTSRQIERWAAQAAHGELVLTAALTDEDTVHAERIADRWILTGSQTTVPAAPYADLILVPAFLDTAPNVGPDPDAVGGPSVRAPAGATPAAAEIHRATRRMAVFLVAPTDEGVTLEPQRVAGGEGAGWLELANVTLPDDRLLGSISAGAEIVEWLLAHATVGLCAMQLGVVERALEMTSEYARTRVQFGRAIGNFQAVAQRLADAYIDVEAIRLTMWQAAWRLSEGLSSQTEVSTAKFWAADAGHRVAHTAVHVHGGVGIDLDYPLHRYFLAAKHHEFALGSAVAHLRLLGAALA